MASHACTSAASALRTRSLCLGSLALSLLGHKTGTVRAVGAEFQGLPLGSVPFQSARPRRGVVLQYRRAPSLPLRSRAPRTALSRSPPSKPLTRCRCPPNLGLPAARHSPASPEPQGGPPQPRGWSRLRPACCPSAPHWGLRRHLRRQPPLPSRRALSGPVVQASAPGGRGCPPHLSRGAPSDPPQTVWAGPHPSALTLLPKAALVPAPH